MPTDVVMPQMGESIAEGTIVRWIKQVGDKIDRDEPLFEISTDKVDAEIPSPAAGVLKEIHVREGETVPVNSVVGVIGEASDREGEQQTAEEAIHQRSSPLVRQIAKEHNVDISQIRGTGISGRVTKQDILGYLEGQPKAAPSAPPKKIGEPGRTEKMSVMRKKIAEHMLASRRTSAHVHSVFEVNFTRVDQIRKAKKAEYERAGAKLTYLAFIIKAAAEALREMPLVNASIDGENVVYHKEINIGIAVALDWGLIVPVIKHADEKNLLGISRAAADLAERARKKQLTPDDVSGGTFTITNPGVFGALLGMPIINQPQVAILGVGNIEKRPVVVGDAIGISSMAYLTLGYDHRLIDGAVADRFMSLVKTTLEKWDAADA